MLLDNKSLYMDVQRYLDMLNVYKNTEGLSQSIVDFTREHFSHGAHMLLDEKAGRFLAMCVQLLQPSCVVEIGTFTGFSALHLLCRLKKGARLYTIDTNNKHLEAARKQLSSHEKYKQITFQVGDATDILSTFEHTIDIAFIDANKRSYIHHYEIIKTKLRQGGVILVDNALFYGEVLKENRSGVACSIHEFNIHVSKDVEVMASLLPISDGLWFIIKK